MPPIPSSGHRLPESVEKELGLIWHEKREEMYGVCDVITLNCPLHSETEHMINEETLKLFKRGACLANTARGKLSDRDVISRALESCRLEGRPIRDEYLIVDKGDLAGVGAKSYSKGNATTGHDATA